MGGPHTFTIKTVFGQKPLFYLDFTASGKALTFVESYIQERILPMYANTHTMQSATGQQTTSLRNEARQYIKRAINANDKDALIFVGSGSTSASNLLIN